MSEETTLLHEEGRYLPVKLTPQELLDKVDQFSETLRLEGQVKARHDAEKARMKDEVDTMTARRKREAEIIESRHEDRRVPVHHILFAAATTVREVRQDTGEVLRERAATREELQRSLPIDMSDPEQREAVEEATEEATREELVDEEPIAEGDAYNDGALAALNGWQLDDNPFDKDAEAVNWQCWVDGFKKAAEGGGDADAE